MLFTFDGLLALIRENRVKANSTFLATISSAVREAVQRDKPEGGLDEAAFTQIVSMHANALFEFVADCASDAGKADKFRSSYEELEASVLRASIEDLLRSARASVAGGVTAAVVSVAQDDFPEDYTHYQVLEIATNADFSAIKAAYYAAARLHHPDKGGSPAKFRRIDEAYKILGDPQRRGQYNLSQGIASPALPATAAVAGERADHLDDGYSLASLKEYPLSYEKLSSPEMVRLIQSIPRVFTSNSPTTDYFRDFNAELIRQQNPFFSQSKLIEFSGALKNFDDLLFLLSQTAVSLRSLIMSQLSEDNLRACLSGSVEGTYLALTDATPLSVSATAPMVMREAGAVSPSQNSGIATPEQLVAIIKCLGAGGAEVINRYAPGRMRELIPNLEVFLQLCRSIGSQPMKSEFVMSFGQEGLSALMGELDFPWQLAGVLNAVYKPADIALLLDLCKDRFLSIVRDFNELKNLLRLLMPKHQLQILTGYWDKVRLLLPADFTEADIHELKWAMRNPDLGPTLEALMFETLPELKRLALTDASAVDTMNVYQKFLAQIKNPESLGVFLASLQPDQQMDLIVNSWPRMANIVQQIAKSEDLLGVFRGLGSDVQSLLLQRIFQPEKPLLLLASLRAAAASSDTALVLRSGSAASHGVAGALSIVRATASAGTVASTAATAPLTNRAVLLSFLPDALASSLNSIQEFSRLMGTLRPELKLEILAQFLPAPTKEDKHTYLTYRDKNLTDQDRGIINALEKERYGCYRLYGRVEPPILQRTLYGLALAYGSILRPSASGVMGYMSGARGKLASLDLVIHAMETGIKLTGDEQKCLVSHAVANHLYGKCSEMLTAPSLSPSETSVSSYTPRR